MGVAIDAVLYNPGNNKYGDPRQTDSKRDNPAKNHSLLNEIMSGMAAIPCITEYSPNDSKNYLCYSR